MPVALFFLLYQAAFHCTVSADLLSEYAHHAVLDTAEKIKLFWTIDWDAESVSFALEAATTGWVGFGFSGRSGQMVGSDVVIGWVKDNKGYLTDRYADEKAIPPIDEQQDYKLEGFQESGGKTLLKFTRKFDTCDPRDRKLEVGATKVVFAYHSEDPVSTTDMKRHESRGTRTILLLNSMDKRNINEDGWKKFTLTARNMTIPGNYSTAYWCTLLKGPELKSKHHITKVVPYIQKGNEGFVHHMIFYECDGNFTEDHFDEGVDCDSRANMPYQECRRYAMVAAWAVGGQAFYYPEHVGLAIGASDSPKYFLLETHYDNPSLTKGQKDSSGLTFYYTDKLRKYDAGIAAVGVGVNSWHIIPPKQKNWLSVGYCMHQCTESLFKNQGLPEGGGINVFAGILHTHLAGRATWTKHIRNGKELPEIARDNHYDFNFQDTQVFRKEINIQPGDDLVHYCKYDSMDRNKLIQGGEATRDEMCLDFLFYYPNIKEFQFCQNWFYEPSFKFIKKYFPNVNVTRRFRNPLVNMEIQWTDEMANDFRKYLSEVETLIPRCWLRNLTSVADIKNPKFRVPVAKITEPLPPQKTCPTPPVSVADVTAPRALFVAVLCIVIQALL
ncbi:DBH-like monooxygenase protein 1 [Porites harrisoni]